MHVTATYIDPVDRDLTGWLVYLYVCVCVSVFEYRPHVYLAPLLTCRSAYNVMMRKRSILAITRRTPLSFRTKMVICRRVDSISVTTLDTHQLGIYIHRTMKNTGSHRSLRQDATILKLAYIFLKKIQLRGTLQ